MKKSRQDAWSKEEDIFLANTVLAFISEGKTQLEAFQRAAEELSRTSAACGYRWNAAVRKTYGTAVVNAKSQQKFKPMNHDNAVKSYQGERIDSVITLLEQLKSEGMLEESERDVEAIEKLTEVNKHLQKKIKRYEDAWREMGKLWQWIHQMDARLDEHG